MNVLAEWITIAVCTYIIGIPKRHCFELCLSISLCAATHVHSGTPL